MKSYSDIEQSKVLAKILPLESADLYYEWPNKRVHFKDDKYSGMGFSCWSLTALFYTLPNPKVYQAIGGYWYCECWKNAKDVKGDESTYIGYTKASNPIDACYKMILKLHELNLL